MTQPSVCLIVQGKMKPQDLQPQMPELYKIAQAMLSVPSTQVSVDQVIDAEELNPSKNILFFFYYF
jgi:hypothetical protein